MRLLGDAHLLQQLHRLELRFPFRQTPDVSGRERDVVEHGEVREQVEALEHHAGLAAHVLDVAEVVGELDAADDDATGVVFFETVDAPDHRRLARTRRTDDNDYLLAADLHADVSQRLERTEELVDVFELDDRFTLQRLRGIAELVHRWPTPSLRSTR